MQRAQLIRQLVLDSQYVIDEHQVADAILARAVARRLVGEAAFRNDPRAQRAARVRSFRPSSHARSFRPCTLERPPERRRLATHLGLM
ncbi:MAG TPA: hypothetical protein VHW67_00900 [Solirubrobacteraceae bacterium]|jgi:hypothetical protein|nr:hypothetical protein [Solirubrobacteraceae bacterium]